MRLRALRRLEEIRDQGRAQEALPPSARTSTRCSKDEKRQWAEIVRGGRRRPSASSAARPARPAPHRARRRAGRDRACRSRLSSSASRSPCCARRRAGSARSRAISTTRPWPSSSTRKATDRALPSMPSRSTGPGVRHQRPLLHAGLRQAAERARPWRAAAADDRARQRAGHRAARGAEGRAQVPGGVRRRARLRRAGGRGRGADQERQAGAEPRRQGEGPGLRRRAGAMPTRSRRSAKAASS